MAKVQFYGTKNGEYPGARRPACDPGDVEATGWGASIDDRTFYSFSSREEALSKVPFLIKQAYYLGREDKEKEILGKIRETFFGGGHG